MRLALETGTSSTLTPIFLPMSSAMSIVEALRLQVRTDETIGG